MSSLVNTILVPVDFSSFSKEAAKTAVSFASKLQADILLLHVMDVVDYGSFKLAKESSGEGGGDSFQDLTEKIAIETLEQFVQSLDAQGVKIKTKISTGKVHRKILEESEKTGVDLIIMGTHGCSGIDNLLGSTTRRIIRFSEVPVLWIHDELRFDDIKRIAFASSFNQEYTFSFPTIYQFMEIFDAELFLVKVITPKHFEPSYYSMRIIKDFAEEFLIEDYQLQLINDVSVEDGLEWFCMERGIDLLFMTTHGREGLSRWLARSHTETTGQRGGCPVFSLRMMKVETPKGVIFPE